MRVRRNRLAASRTGCLASPRRSTTAGTSALKWSLKWSPARTAAESRAWSAPCETLKLLSFKRSKQQSTREVTPPELRLLLEASSTSWRRSTPAMRSFASFARASSSASSIGSGTAGCRSGLKCQRIHHHITAPGSWEMRMQMQMQMQDLKGVRGGVSGVG